jgi:DNA-directed RNA polymerase subunit RPC12/RpoP
MRNGNGDSQKHANEDASELQNKNWQEIHKFVLTKLRREAGIVCVDCDSVILYHERDEHLKVGKVLREGRMLVNLLQKLGWRVVVLTARAKRHQELLTYLHKRNVWADKVTNVKPYADAYFDDKAVRVSKNWR